MITNSITRFGVSLTVLGVFLFSIWYWQNSLVDKPIEESRLQSNALEKEQDDRCAMDAEVLRVENGVFECSVDSNGNPIRWILQGYDD